MGDELKKFVEPIKGELSTQGEAETSGDELLKIVKTLVSICRKEGFTFGDVDEEIDYYEKYFWQQKAKEGGVNLEDVNDVITLIALSGAAVLEKKPEKLVDILVLLGYQIKGGKEEFQNEKASLIDKRISQGPYEKFAKETFFRAEALLPFLGFLSEVRENLNKNDLARLYGTFSLGKLDLALFDLGIIWDDRDQKYVPINEEAAAANRERVENALALLGEKSSTLTYSPSADTSTDRVIKNLVEKESEIQKWMPLLGIIITQEVISDKTIPWTEKRLVIARLGETLILALDAAAKEGKEGRAAPLVDYFEKNKLDRYTFFTEAITYFGKILLFLIRKEPKKLTDAIIGLAEKRRKKNEISWEEETIAEFAGVFLEIYKQDPEFFKQVRESFQNKGFVWQEGVVFSFVKSR